MITSYAEVFSLESFTQQGEAVAVSSEVGQECTSLFQCLCHF